MTSGSLKKITGEIRKFFFEIHENKNIPKLMRYSENNDQRDMYSYKFLY